MENANSSCYCSNRLSLLHALHPVQKYACHTIQLVPSIFCGNAHVNPRDMWNWRMFPNFLLVVVKTLMTWCVTWQRGTFVPAINLGTCARRIFDESSFRQSTDDDVNSKSFKQCSDDDHNVTKWLPYAVGLCLARNFDFRVMLGLIHATKRFIHWRKCKDCFIRRVIKMYYVSHDLFL